MQEHWDLAAVTAIYQQPFNDLLQQAHTVHLANHPKNSIQLAQLLSIKTGACPENCGYCSQSGQHNTALEKEKFFSVDAVLESARAAKANGASRFCMGAAWRSPPAKAMPQLVEMIQGVNALGMESCLTAGMLNQEQADTLKQAGLHFYNHNLDTAESHYPKVVQTRSYQDRLETLNCLNKAGIAVCCGGILGLGETEAQRIEFLHALANLPEVPESLPLNRLIPIPGTPLEKSPEIDEIEFVRCIATARILMPKTVVRLSAGRSAMSDALQALCFYAGASSVHIGAKLLTTENPSLDRDKALFARLGLQAQEAGSCSSSV